MYNQLTMLFIIIVFGGEGAGTVWRNTYRMGFLCHRPLQNQDATFTVHNKFVKVSKLHFTFNNRTISGIYGQQVLQRMTPCCHKLENKALTIVIPKQRHLQQYLLPTMVTGWLLNTNGRIGHESSNSNTSAYYCTGQSTHYKGLSYTFRKIQA